MTAPNNNTSPAGFAVCFSGHRPEKLPQDSEMKMLISMLYLEIRSAIQDGADCFYTGMAEGIDLIAAEIVVSFRKEDPDIRLIAVRPFADHGRGLCGIERYRYDSILDLADEVVILAPHFSKSCFRERNAYMVERSRRLIAVVQDMRSGTGQTIRMAQRKGLETRIITLNRNGSILAGTKGGQSPSAE